MSSSPEAGVLRGRSAAEFAPFVVDAVPVMPSHQQDAVRLGDVYAVELDRLREQARQEGFDAGFQSGLAAAETAVAEASAEAQSRAEQAQAAWEARAAQAVHALTAAAASLDARTVPTVEELRDLVAAGSFTVVEMLLGRELAAAANPGLDAIRRALALLPVDAPVVVRVHPADHDALGAEALTGLPATVTVVPDPAVEPGGAVADAGAQRVDAQLSTALARVRQVLSS